MAADERRCPKCGAKQAANAPEGLCARCGTSGAAVDDTLGVEALSSPADTGSGRPPVAAAGGSEPTAAHVTRTVPGSASVRTAAAGESTMDLVESELTAGDDGGSPELPRGATVRYFGDYEIEKVLGLGGMGVVYQARQVTLQRPVALKMIKTGVLADDTELRRFQNEAEAVALLDHPGIVPVYEVGEHDGQRYLSMKLVEGGNLSERLAALAFTPRAAATLLAETAEAVHHAHIRGILHRDLKPANILIDAEGRPHVTDFGLAKRIESDLELTASGAIMGTPAYMSPEQAAGRRGSITTATDVYGLGAVFYAILTGKAPFGGDSIIETLDAVRTRPPDPPRKRNAQVPRDLETICLKCLEKDPRRRYPSALALADDLHAWLGSRPIAARRVGTGERAWLWCRRKPAVASMAAAVLLAVLGGISAVIAVQAGANEVLRGKNAELLLANDRATRANVDLNSANERVKQRFDLATEAIKLFHGEVSEDLLLKEKEFAGLRSRLLKGAAGFYGKLEHLMEGQPDLESRSALGRAYFELAELTRQIGANDDALTIHRKALAVRRELAARPGADPEAVLDVVRSLLDMAIPLADRNDKAGSQASRAEARKLAEGLVAAGLGGDEARALLAESLMDLITSMPDPRGELETARRARAIAEELVGKHPGVARHLEKLGASHIAIGYVFQKSGRPAEMIGANLEAMAIYQRLVADQPDVSRHQDRLAKLCNNIASGLSGLGRLDEAVASERRAVAIWRRQAEANPALTSVGNNLIYGLNELASYLIDNGRPAEALERLAEARPMVRRMLAVDPGSSLSLVHLPYHHFLTAKALARMGRRNQAREAFEESASIWRSRVDEQPSNLLSQRWLAGSCQVFGWTFGKSGWTAEAIPAYIRARAVRERIVAADPKNRPNRDALAGCETQAAAALLAEGRPSESRACSERALALREDLIRADPGNESYFRGLAETLLRLGGAKAATGDAAGAAADWRRAAGLHAAHPSAMGEPEILRACCHGALAGLANVPGSGVSTVDAAAQSETAMTILRRVEAGGYRDPNFLRVEPGLDPLRSRDDFRLLMSDLVFPSEPFARGD